MAKKQITIDVGSTFDGKGLKAAREEVAKLTRDQVKAAQEADRRAALGGLGRFGETLKDRSRSGLNESSKGLFKLFTPEGAMGYADVAVRAIEHVGNSMEKSRLIEQQFGREMGSVEKFARMVPLAERASEAIEKFVGEFTGANEALAYNTKMAEAADRANVKLWANLNAGAEAAKARREETNQILMSMGGIGKTGADAQRAAAAEAFANSMAQIQKIKDDLPNAKSQEDRESRLSQAAAIDDKAKAKFQADMAAVNRLVKGEFHGLFDTIDAQTRAVQSEAQTGILNALGATVQSRFAQINSEADAALRGVRSKYDQLKLASPERSLQFTVAQGEEEATIEARRRTNINLTRGEATRSQMSETRQRNIDAAKAQLDIENQLFEVERKGLALRAQLGDKAAEKELKAKEIAKDYTETRRSLLGVLTSEDATLSQRTRALARLGGLTAEEAAAKDLAMASYGREFRPPPPMDIHGDTRLLTGVGGPISAYGAGGDDVAKQTDRVVKALDAMKQEQTAGTGLLREIVHIFRQLGVMN